MQDDLQQLLGIRNDPTETVALKELARRANDSIRVFNPTSEDYNVAWALYDEVNPGGYFLVPHKDKDIGYGKGQNVHPRYIAFKFFKEITGIMLSAEMVLAIERENERRLKSNMSPLDKTFATSEELKFIYQNKVNLDRQDKLMELLPKIILGIEREWGMDALAYKPRVDQVNWADVLKIVDRPVGSDTKDVIVKPQADRANDEVLKGVAA